MTSNLFLDKKIENSKKENEIKLVNKKNKYKLIKNNLVFFVNINYGEKNKDYIKIKTSQIFNNNFYLYEGIIDSKYIFKNFKDCKNLEQGYLKLIDLFENKKVTIQDIIINDFILLILEINSIENIELRLLKENKEKNIIIKELIDKYISLEKEYFEMEKNLTIENISLKKEIEKLKKPNKIIHFNTNNFMGSENQIINNESEYDDENHITIDSFSTVWCMLKLNEIKYKKDEENLILNLVAIGLSDSQINLINLTTLKIHQILKGTNIVYSLSQFNNNPKYLFSSFSNGYIIIYKLKENNYEEIQKMKKPNEFQRGEINKVIALSNGDLASGDRKSITIWRQKKDENNNKIDEFEFFKEIITYYDTCHLIEINPNIFACAIYTTKVIKIFKNDKENYPLLGIINNVESQGNSSNGMAKINDRLFCSGGKDYFVYVISIEPIQLIQKIKILENNDYTNLIFLYINNGYFFTSYKENIIEFKIIYDEDNNFVEFKKIDIIQNKEYESKAMITTYDKKIFYQIKKKKVTFFLTPFKT